MVWSWYGTTNTFTFVTLVMVVCLHDVCYINTIESDDSQLCVARRYEWRLIGDGIGMCVY